MGQELKKEDGESRVERKRKRHREIESEEETEREGGRGESREERGWQTWARKTAAHYGSSTKFPEQIKFIN